jgi:hypothetical protein
VPTTSRQEGISPPTSGVSAPPLASRLTLGQSSSSMMKPVASLTATNAFCGFSRVRRNVSLPSTAVSPLTVMSTVRLVSPALKVTVPFLDW